MAFIVVQYLVLTIVTGPLVMINKSFIITVADSRGGGGALGASAPPPPPPPSNKSSTYINIRFSRLIMAFNRTVSICVMKVKENTN